MVASLSEIITTSYWDAWRAVKAPTLVVRGENGVPRHATRRMIELHHNATLAEIAGAGHDLHLEQPEQWRQALHDFVRSGGRAKAR